RTFTYTSAPLLTDYTDFKGNTGHLAYGMGGGYSGNGLGIPTKYTDFRQNLTTVTRNPLTLVAPQVTFPLTPEDTPANSPAGTVAYSYISTSCSSDPTHCDSNNMDS